MEMSSDFNFTVASWFLGNVHVKPISTHSAPPRIFRPSYGPAIQPNATACFSFARRTPPIFMCTTRPRTILEFWEFFKPCSEEEVNLSECNKGQKSVNLKSNFSWNSIAPKTNRILDKILAYKATAEFCQIFCLFFGQWSFKKKCFWILLSFSKVCQKIQMEIIHNSTTV